MGEGGNTEPEKEKAEGNEAIMIIFKDMKDHSVDRELRRFLLCGFEPTGRSQKDTDFSAM